MGKLVKIGCVVAVIFAVLIAVGVYIGFSSGSATQEKFFQAFATDDPAPVMALMHPELRKVIDPPILRAWQKAFNKNLGAFKGLKLNGFSTSSKVENGMKLYESKGEAEFEKGTAQVELNYVDDQIVKFTVESPQMPKAWFTGPDGTEFYREKAKEFWARFFRKEADAAWGMLGSQLQDKVSQVDFNKQVEEITTNFGTCKAMTFQTEKFEETEDTQDLRIFFRLDTDHGPAEGMTKFQFIGLRGVLLGYNIKPAEGQ
ncbi:MAG: hypothetical protein GX442_17665 [Candidatus Riflebacteria bacterium]|nr:hypothetical protein [Candidatus Riflebacteria bacterium]